MYRFNIFTLNHTVMNFVKLLFIATLCLSFFFTFWLIFEDHPTNSAKIYNDPTDTSKHFTLLVDEDCLSKIPPFSSNNADLIGLCSLPLKVAILSSRNWSQNSDILQNAWIMEKENPRKDFWIFNKIGEVNEQKALKRFATSSATIVLRSGIRYELAIPVDLPRFLRHWRHGGFIPCDVILRRTEAELRNRFLPVSMIDRLAEMSDHMDRFNVTGFLMGGTLLGWRRECSLIPHTTDTDMGILAEDHSSALLDYLLHSDTFQLTWIFGHPRRFLEFSGFVDNNPKHKIDVFYLHYNVTRDKTVINGQIEQIRQRIRWVYPRVQQICAGEMGHRLFHVPCNHDIMLGTDYGPEGWKMDLPSNKFTWDSKAKHMEYGEIFNEMEWKLLFTKYYPKTENGTRNLPKWD